MHRSHLWRRGLSLVAALTASATLLAACGHSSSHSTPTNGGIAPAFAPVDAWTVLGSATSYAVIGGSAITNTGPTTITGDVGLSPGSAITGFPPAILNGTKHVADAAAVQAQIDVTAGYNALANAPSNFNLTGKDLGGMTLIPGVYTFSSSAQLTGRLTLNSMGNPDSVFIFQIGSTLTTGSNSSVVMINPGRICGHAVFWQVGSSATLGTGTLFEGTIVALTSITLETGANIVEGRALARNGAVTLDTNALRTPQKD